MSTPDLTFWLHTLAGITLATSLVVLAAAVMQARLRTARWQRAIWRATVPGLALVLGLVFTGADRWLPTWPVTSPAESRVITARGNLPATLPAAATSPVSDPSTATDAAPASAAVWWPGWLWMAGTAAFSLWALGVRLVFNASLRQGHQGVPDRAAQHRLTELARRLGLRRPVRILESPALPGPVACGWLRPTIGLPAGFWSSHTRSEQEVMLAHELAHLAARDPLWLGLLDGVTALLWWHPLVWWLRRQLRASSEAAADEASLLVDDGPEVLAGCLVALAARLPERRALGWLGMAAFRSSLGRRVDRLLHLQPTDAPRAPRLSERLVLLGVSLALILTVVTLSTWIQPATAADQPTFLELAQQAVHPPELATAPYPAPSAPAIVAVPAAVAPTPTPPTNLFTRLFRVDPNTLLQSLEAVAGARPKTELPADWSTRALRSFFARVGVQLTPEKSVYFNERNGMVLVRATLDDMVIVQSAIETLNQPVPQLTIETKFIELPWAEFEALGLAWKPVPETAAQPTNSLLPGAPRLPAVHPGTHLVNITNTQPTLSCLLKPAEYRQFVQRLEQRPGIDILAAPRVTTLSGRQAHVSVMDMKNIITGLNPLALADTHAKPATNVPPLLTQNIPTGIALDMLPTVEPDGYSIRMTVIPSMTEFLGYELVAKPRKERVWDNGKVRRLEVPPPPRLRLRQMLAEVRVLDGQTLVLGGMACENIKVQKDSVPVLGAIPGLGRAFRRESRQVEKKGMLVLVTATQVDPAGNRVHEEKGDRR